jgi:hypothetical protein
MPVAFFRTLTSREAEAIVEIGGSSEHLSQLAPVSAAGRSSCIGHA